MLFLSRLDVTAHRSNVREGVEGLHVAAAVLALSCHAGMQA